MVSLFQDKDFPAKISRIMECPEEAEDIVKTDYRLGKMYESLRAKTSQEDLEEVRINL
jgi:hypothetical protein